MSDITNQGLSGKKSQSQDDSSSLGQKDKLKKQQKGSGSYEEQLELQEPEQKGMTNEQIRQWYNNQVAVVPALNEGWIKEGLSAKERAYKAWEIRHQARIQARAMMSDPEEVRALQERDMKEYGNPDGPTFEDLVKKAAGKGLQGDDIYEYIIGSSNRTNAEYNKKFGVVLPGKQ